MLTLAKSFLKRQIVEHRRRADAVRRASLSSEFGGLPPRLWGYTIDSGDYLCIDGHRVTDLVDRFGSPLHVVSLPWLKKTHDEFLWPFQADGTNVRLATSYKTNPLPSVISALHDLGTYAEVISEFELWLAGRLGLSGDRIIVNGPGKTKSMLARAVDMRVKLINIDGLGEIDLIAAEARRASRPQPVGVRVVTSVGWSSQFGLPISSGDAFSAFAQMRENPWLVPVGLHLHLGTGIRTVHTYLRAVQELLDFSRSINDRLGIELYVFDLGGGFAVPTVRSIDEWDDHMVSLGYPLLEAFPGDCPAPSDYAGPIKAIFDGATRSNGTPHEIILEPGRAITSGAQSLLLRVIAVKETNGVKKLVLDGGRNITMPLAWETHKIFPGSRLRQPFAVKTDLYGPLCHPGDVVARHLPLPTMGVGDVIAIMDAGAYFIPNQMNFSNPRPAVVTVRPGEVCLARRREDFEDMVRCDEIP